MDLLLAHGYFLRDDPGEQAIMRPYPPLGILYLSAYLKSRGFDVGVFDATFESREAFRALLVEQRPPVVGLYCNMMTRTAVLEMIREAKDVGAVVVVGGPEPPYYAAEFLSSGADIVVTGEAEHTLEELVPAIRRHGPHRLADIPGVVFTDQEGAMIQTADRPFVRNLDTLPWPDRAATDLSRYMNMWKTRHGHSSLSLITARGCPYRCAWCSHAVFGTSHRRRSPENVTEEIDHLVETYNPDMLWFADDVFTIHHGWMFRFAEAMKKRGLRRPFECISRADRLNENVIETLASLGCHRLWIGSESGSQRILDAMRRDVTVDCIREMTGTARRHGIQVGLFVMLGYEGEEIADLEATVDHLKRAAPDLFLTTVAYPIRGTPYYREVESRLIDRLPWEKGSDRDLGVGGRHSRRFYRYANRWMVNEVMASQRWNGPRRDYAGAAKAFLSARLGRWGMRLASREREE